MEGLLNIRSTALRLGLSEHTIRHWVRDGRLGHIRLGRRIVFDRRALARFVKERRIEAREIK
jgi:excisionase family DNA binding protein